MTYKMPRVIYKTKRDQILEDDTRNKAITFTKEAVLAAICIVLKDEFQFGPKRYKQLLDRFDNQWDCVIAGTVSIDDLVKWYYKEVVDKLEELK